MVPVGVCRLCGLRQSSIGPAGPHTGSGVPTRRWALCPGRLCPTLSAGPGLDPTSHHPPTSPLVASSAAQTSNLTFPSPNLLPWGPHLGDGPPPAQGGSQETQGPAHCPSPFTHQCHPRAPVTHLHGHPHLRDPLHHTHPPQRPCTHASCPPPSTPTGSPVTGRGLDRMLPRPRPGSGSSPPPPAQPVCMRHLARGPQGLPGSWGTHRLTREGTPQANKGGDLTG